MSLEVYAKLKMNLVLVLKNGAQFKNLVHDVRHRSQIELKQ